MVTNGLSHGPSWLDLFQKILRPKRPVRATCVSLELFSIDWSHRWILIYCYSNHFWIYTKKKKSNFWYWGQRNSLLIILIRSVKYGCTVFTLHKSGQVRGLREQNVNHHLFPIHIFRCEIFLPKKATFLICTKLRLIYAALIWITGLEWLISYALYIKWNFWIIFSNCTSNKTTSVCSLVCTGPESWRGNGNPPNCSFWKIP